ncbi:hypothetical protein GC194_03310 [bacterium]|nr:hypothetical protein [bacterium]
MTAAEFKLKWTKNGDSTSPIKVDQLQSFGLNKNTIDFLTIAGLPEEASPFLTFVGDSASSYDRISTLALQYDTMASDDDSYLIIGSDGSGNPIAIDTKHNDQIVWLDHEQNFSSNFMNSSIHQLAAFLLIYRAFNEAIIKLHGDDAVLNCTFTENEYDMLKQEMTASKALACESGFWCEELKLLLVNREYYRHGN